MKTWCRHIRWHSGSSFDAWEINGKRWIGTWEHFLVPKAWKVCPICLTERPSRAKIKGIAMRMILENLGDKE